MNMTDAFIALRKLGVSDEEMEEVLSRDIPIEVRVGLSQQQKQLAILVTLIAAAARAECNQELYEAVDRVFLAGWNAAIEMASGELVH